MTGLWRLVLDGIARQLRSQERDARPSFTCPRCHRASHHPMDLRYGWCGACNDYTATPTERTPHA